jgi:hypothetical protein
MKKQEFQAKAEKQVQDFLKAFNQGQIVLGGKVFTFESAGKYSVCIKGERGASYRVSPCPNCTVDGNKELAVYTISRNSRAVDFTLINGKYTELK